MANTERINVLKKVREAENIVTDTIEKPGLTTLQHGILDDLSDILREIDNLLLLNELNDSIEELKNISIKLKTINNRTKKQIDKLEEVADKVDIAVKGIDAIVKAFGLFVAADLV
jgi:SpoU rRNA methylase family enzyme